MLFIGTQFSNLYTAVDTPANGRVRVTPVMMLDPIHTSTPMLMRGNALVLKTPVENAPRNSIEKHLSWSSDIPPAARFPLHQSRPAEYQPNRQPATVCAESGAGEARQRVGRRRGRLTSGARQSLRVLVIQSSVPDIGQHLTVPISTNDLHCLKPARRWQHRVRSTPTLPTAPPQRPSRHVPHT